VTLDRRKQALIQVGAVVASQLRAIWSKGGSATVEVGLVLVEAFYGPQEWLTAHQVAQRLPQYSEDTVRRRLDSAAELGLVERREDRGRLDYRAHPDAAEATITALREGVGHAAPLINR
jgi:hypothetical protein